MRSQGRVRATALRIAEVGRIRLGFGVFSVLLLLSGIVGFFFFSFFWDFRILLLVLLFGILAAASWSF